MMCLKNKNDINQRENLILVSSAVQTTQFGVHIIWECDLYSLAFFFLRVICCSMCIYEEYQCTIFKEKPTELYPLLNDVIATTALDSNGIFIYEAPD